MNSSGDMNSVNHYDHINNQPYCYSQQNQVEHNGIHSKMVHMQQPFSNVKQTMHTSGGHGSQVMPPTPPQHQWNGTQQHILDSASGQSLNETSPLKKLAQTSTFSNSVSNHNSPNQSKFKSPTNGKPEMHSLNMPASIYPYNKQLVAIGKNKEYLKRMQSNEQQMQNMMLQQQQQQQSRLNKSYQSNMYSDMRRPLRGELMSNNYRTTLNTQKQYELYHANNIQRFPPNASLAYPPSSPNQIHRYGYMFNNTAQYKNLKKMQKINVNKLPPPILNPQILRHGMQPIQRNGDIQNNADDNYTNEEQSDIDDTVKLNNEDKNDGSNINKSVDDDRYSQLNEDEEFTDDSNTSVDPMLTSESCDMSLPIYQNKPNQANISSIVKLGNSDDIQEKVGNTDLKDVMHKEFKFPNSKESQIPLSNVDNSQSAFSVDAMKYNQLDGIREQLEAIKYAGRERTSILQTLPAFKSDSLISVNNHPNGIYQHNRNIHMYPMSNTSNDQFKRPLPSPHPSRSLTERQRQIGNELLSRDVMRDRSPMRIASDKLQQTKHRIQNFSSIPANRLLMHPPMSKTPPMKRPPLKRKSAEMGGIKISLMLKNRRILKPSDQLHPPANSPVKCKDGSSDNEHKSYPVNSKLLFANMSRIIRLNNQSKNVAPISSLSNSTIVNSDVGSISNMSFSSESGVRTSASCMSLVDDSSPSCTTFQRPTILIHTNCGELNSLDSSNGRPSSSMASLADSSESTINESTLEARGFEEELRDVAQVQPSNRITEPVTLTCIKACKLNELSENLPELYMQSNSLLNDDNIPHFINEKDTGLINVPALVVLDDLSLRMLLEEVNISLNYKQCYINIM